MDRRPPHIYGLVSGERQRVKKIIPNSFAQSKRIAIKDYQGVSKTYEELFAEADCWRELIGKRSVVCVLCDNSFDAACFILEMFLDHQVLFILSSDVDMPLLEKLIELYAPRYVWMKESMAKDFSWTIGWQDTTALTGGSGYKLYRTAFQVYPIHPELALLLSTSGSTGSPKMVRLSYGNLLNSVRISAETLQLDGECGFAMVLPLCHVFALSFCLSIWHCGGTVYPVGIPLMSNRFAQFYSEERINCFIGVPTIYQMMRKIEFWNENRVRNLRLACCGGARLPSELQCWLISKMKDKLYLLYGQTETASSVIGAHFSSLEYKLGTIGKELGDVKIVTCADGELLIRSRSICMGYAYGYQDLSKPDENHGTIYTGDLAYIDENGYVFLKGRKTRSVNILGNRTNLDELENLLQENFPTISPVCVGDDDSIFVCSSNPQISSMEYNIRQYLIEVHRIPFRMVQCVCLREIPVLYNGKVDYKKLHELAGEADRHIRG